MPNGKWRAEVSKDGKRLSKVRNTKKEAREWAARAEYEVTHGGKIAAAMPFRDVLDRYAREVSPKKRGHRWEVIRLEKIGKDPLCSIRVGDLRPADFADWRDRRLRDVAPASVRREMVLLSAVLSVARKEWEYLTVSPMQDVTKPSPSPARDRRPAPSELTKLAEVAGDDLTLASARAFHAFLFAIETGMRAGEIVGLRVDDVDTKRRVAILPKTKNGSAREVPLSTEAVRLIEALPEADPMFGLTSRQLESLWRRVRDKAKVQGLTFHDSRHEAITRLSKKLDVLALAKMVGHRDIKMLMTYYDESAEELAKRLD